MVVGMLLVTIGFWGADSETKDNRSTLIEALRPVGPLVGEWKGIVTPQDRKSLRERVFWRETSQWEWVFDEVTGLQWTIAENKLYKGGLLTYRPKDKTFRLEMEAVDGTKTAFVGKEIEGRLELDSPVKNGIQQRLWIRAVNDDRFLYSLFEREENKSRFVKVLEGGNTREGVTFAAGSGGPECIVTGGRGTMTVSYKGKTYYVCCTGCKQAFDDDPEGIIAEAESKKSNKK